MLISWTCARAQRGSEGCPPSLCQPHQLPLTVHSPLPRLPRPRHPPRSACPLSSSSTRVGRATPTGATRPQSRGSQRGGGTRVQLGCVINLVQAASPLPLSPTPISLLTHTAHSSPAATGQPACEEPALPSTAPSSHSQLHTHAVCKAPAARPAAAPARAVAWTSCAPSCR